MAANDPQREMKFCLTPVRKTVGAAVPMPRHTFSSLIIPHSQFFCDACKDR